MSPKKKEVAEIAGFGGGFAVVGTSARRKNACLRRSSSTVVEVDSLADKS